MTAKKRVVLAFGGVTFFTVLVAAFNPLRWPQGMLESYVYEITPLGMSFEDVLDEVTSRDWEISYVTKEKGFFDQRTKDGRVVGDMSIRASLGEYQGLPFKADVTVFWGFNSNAELTEIWVWKTYDAP